MDYRKYILLMVVVFYVTHLAIERLMEANGKPGGYLWAMGIYWAFTAFLFVGNYITY